MLIRSDLTTTGHVSRAPNKLGGKGGGGVSGKSDGLKYREVGGGGGGGDGGGKNTTQGRREKILPAL